MPVISICIPTYNRSQMLAELLDSIIEQRLGDVIEVVVSDDTSPDDTIAVAESYKGRIKHYKFIAQPTNLGVDRNFLAVTAAATGDFIWLMGDDDKIEPGGAQRVLDALKRWPNVVGLTLGVIDYDVEMRRPVGIRKTPPTQVITGASAVFSSMIELLGFMSALVVRRDLWQSQAEDPFVQAVDNYYVQVLILGRIIGKDGQWGVIQEPSIAFRTGNDQFKAKFGWIERLRIDVRAYGDIAEALFADDRAAKTATRQRVFDNHVMARITNAKTAVGRTDGVLSVAAFLAKKYWSLPRFWTRALPMLLAPEWTVREARRAYKRYSKKSGAYGM